MDSAHDPLTLGFERHLAGDLVAAERHYRQCLAAEPRHPDALHLLGALSSQLGRHDEAIALLSQAVEVAPQNAQFVGNFGSALLLAGRDEDALAVLERAISLAPQLPDPHYNLGVVLANLGRLPEAAASYRRSIACNPREPRPYNNLVSVYHLLGQVDAALDVAQQALVLDPTHGGARYNRALTWLKQGRLHDGWQEYEWRWHLAEFPRRFGSTPEWDGSADAQRVVLVHAEQGIGDTLQWIRYLPLVRERCPRAIVQVPARLLPLLKDSGLTGLVADDTPPPACDEQIALSSLPRVFGTTLENIPNTVPYLHARGELVEHWRRELAAYTGRKVGIVWQGNRAFKDDRYRSIPLAAFAPLAKVAGVRLFTLQKGDGEEQIAPLRDELGLIELGSRLDQREAFVDTAAVIRALDLVICSDTSIAHLAGALGRPVWLALSVGPDWRWLMDRSDSPWYPTMRVFRQRTPGDWQPVFADMAAELSRAPT